MLCRNTVPDPITTLAGTQRTIRTGACPGELTVDVKLDRTGDGPGRVTQSQVSAVVVVRKASKSSRHCAGEFLSGSIPVYSPR